MLLPPRICKENCVVDAVSMYDALEYLYVFVYVCVCLRYQGVCSVSPPESVPEVVPVVDGHISMHALYNAYRRNLVSSLTKRGTYRCLVWLDDHVESASMHTPAHPPSPPLPHPSTHRHTRVRARTHTHIHRLLLLVHGLAPTQTTLS